MTNRFVDRPLGKLVLINCGVGIGILIAYTHGYRGLELLMTGLVALVLFNAAGFIGIWFGKKSKPAPPNKYLKSVWIIIGLLWLIYLLTYIFPAK
jgi:hypothetical protein